MCSVSHISQAREKSTNSAELTVLLVVPETGQNPAHSPVLAASLVKIRFTKARRTDKLSKNPFCKLRILTCFLRCFQQTLFPEFRGDAVQTFHVYCIAQAVWRRWGQCFPQRCHEQRGTAASELNLSGRLIEGRGKTDLKLIFVSRWKLSSHFLSMCIKSCSEFCTQPEIPGQWRGGSL